VPSTDSFTSSALAVSSTTGVFGFVVAESVYTPLGFYAKIDPTGVTVTKAASFGSSQSALSFPISRAGAVELANALLNLAG
jgi:hypothetical protein